MRSLGGYPTDEMIDKMIVEYDDDGNEAFEFDEFLRMIVKYNTDMHADPIKELKNACRYVLFSLSTVHYFRWTVSAHVGLYKIYFFTSVVVGYNL